MTLERLRFRRNAKLTCTYDMGDWLVHEIRSEDQLEAESKRYPHRLG